MSDIEANSLALFYASGGDWHADCVEDGLSEGVVTCQLSPTTVFGKWEQGNLQLANRASASGGTATIRIVDGRISHYAIVLGVIALAELTESQDGMREYNGWVEENHPELAGTLFGSSIGQPRHHSRQLPATSATDRRVVSPALSSVQQPGRGTPCHQGVPFVARPASFRRRSGLSRTISARDRSAALG